MKQIKFNRWGFSKKSTWAFQVFQKYNLELESLLTAHTLALKFVYKMLGKSSAQWTDNPTKHFDFTNQITFINKKTKLYSDLKEWSIFYNKFSNWVNLNALMAMTSNLETYMATVISLAIESDPATILEASKMIDGASFLKKKISKKHQYDTFINSCIKGDWFSRISTFKKIFGTAPDFIEQNRGILDDIRNFRNKIAHSFGRDIEASRDHEIIEMMPINKLKTEKLVEYQKIIWKVAKSIDVYLSNNHIGEYQAILFFHNMRQKLLDDGTPKKDWFLCLKKRITKNTNSYGKEFCKGLIDYYDQL